MTIAKKLKKEEEEEEEKTWSVLPDDLLWKIKERLDFVHNLYIVAVCKDWKWASSRYPRRSITTIQFSLPWFMNYGTDDNTKQEFIDPWHRKKYTIPHPDLIEGYVVYSKQGWLLLVNAHYSPFLLNPLTGTKIVLLSLPHIEKFGGTFSVSDGVPGHVVIAGCDYDDVEIPAGEDCPPSFFITSTSEMCWLKYTPSLGRRPLRFILCGGGFLIVGGLVYYFNDFARMLVFDLASLEWRDYKRIERLYDGCDDRIMECEGEIINVCIGRHHPELMNGVRFFKLNLGNNGNNNKKTIPSFRVELSSSE